MSDVVTICIILVYDRMDISLFSPDFTILYVPIYFFVGLSMICESLDVHIHISIPLGDFVVVDRVYYFCVATFMGYKFLIDLVIFDIVDFDVILGMIWLSSYNVVLDDHAKIVFISMSGMFGLEWNGNCSSTPEKIISFICAKRHKKCCNHI
ncbi:hypothetical protein AABB24_033043 [Solanum stoloniferum]|uniref:Uncharacterized protein n=1 Tax=Solanum stoloniferum TaxID=62892 RepID=A0ABD2RLN8_9SOLN